MESWSFDSFLYLTLVLKANELQGLGPQILSPFLILLSEWGNQDSQAYKCNILPDLFNKTFI